MTNYVNEDKRNRELWGEGEYDIPVIIDVDAAEEYGLLCGIKKSDIHGRKLGNRYRKVVYVKGDAQLYYEVTNSYWREDKAGDRDRRCPAQGARGGQIRCPEEVKDPVTGEMMGNSCQNCPYYYSLDKQEFYTIPFSELSKKDAEGNEGEYEPVSSGIEYEADRYLRIVDELVDYVSKIDVELVEIVRLKVAGMDQSEIGSMIGKTQSTVSYRIKKLEPIVKEFLENIAY